MRYSYPAIKVNDTVRLELASGKDPTKVDGRGLHLPSDGRVHREERPLQACAWVALARHQRCEAAVSLFVETCGPETHITAVATMAFNFCPEIPEPDMK
jgi:hypothetical protein